MVEPGATQDAAAAAPRDSGEGWRREEARHWRRLVLDESALRTKNNWDDLDGFHGKVRNVGRSVGLTWPQLQQVVQRFDVPFEVHGARHLLVMIEALR